MSRTYGRFESNNPVPRRRRRARKLTGSQEFVLGMDAIYIAALIWTIYMLFFRVVVVVGPSMYDTLIHGDRLLLVSSLVYQQPQQGDIIVCSKESFEDGTCFIKRVIAIEGQEVDIDFEQGIVYVDGIALEEDYIYTSTNRYEGVDFPVVVEDGHVFVMGDNRANSTDSRSPYIGQVDTRQIVGKAVFLISPGDNNGTEEPRYSRVGWID